MSDHPIILTNECTGRAQEIGSAPTAPLIRVEPPKLRTWATMTGEEIIDEMAKFWHRQKRADVQVMVHRLHCVKTNAHREHEWEIPEYQGIVLYCDGTPR